MGNHLTQISPIKRESEGVSLVSGMVVYFYCSYACKSHSFVFWDKVGRIISGGPNQLIQSKPLHGGYQLHGGGVGPLLTRCALDFHGLRFFLLLLGLNSFCLSFIQPHFHWFYSGRANNLVLCLLIQLQKNKSSKISLLAIQKDLVAPNRTRINILELARWSHHSQKINKRRF